MHGSKRSKYENIQSNNEKDGKVVRSSSTTFIASAEAMMGQEVAQRPQKEGRTGIGQVDVTVVSTHGKSLLSGVGFHLWVSSPSITLGALTT